MATTSPLDGKPMMHFDTNDGLLSDIFMPNAALKAQINATTDVQALISLYLDNTAVIEATPDVKNLLTTRKKALQAI